MILGRLKAKEEFDRVNSLNEEKRGSLPLWREIDQAYLSGGSGHELVTKWVTLGLIREHHPSLHEKRENMEVVAGGRERVLTEFPTSQPVVEHQKR